MNPRIVLRWLLLAVVAGSGVVAWSQRSRPVAAVPYAAPAADRPAAQGPEVVVTYFTTNVRCASCRTIEALSRRAIAEGFPAEVASGKVVFRVVNTDEEQNGHFVDHYELANKTVIVSHEVGGRELEWTNRQDVWLLFGEPEPFFAYLREPVRRYLGRQ